MTIEELNKIVKAFNNGEVCSIGFDDTTIYSLSDTYIEVNKYVLNKYCLNVLNKKTPGLFILRVYDILNYNLTIEKENGFTYYKLRKENKK